MSTRLRAFALPFAVALAACPKPAPPAPEAAVVAAPEAGPWLVLAPGDLTAGRAGPATVVGTLAEDGLHVGDVRVRLVGGGDWGWMVGTRIRVMGALDADADGWRLAPTGAPLPADEP